MFTKISIAVVYSLKFGHEITHKKTVNKVGDLVDSFFVPNRLNIFVILNLRGFVA